MKKIFIYAALFISSLMAACQNTNSSGHQKNSDDEKEEIEDKKNVSKRDYSINKSNSYSNLFLDSMAMEKYIAVQKLHDSLSHRLRSFYNTRNYQFAWFTSKGLTEQARAFWN